MEACGDMARFKLLPSLEVVLSLVVTFQIAEKS